MLGIHDHAIIGHHSGDLLSLVAADQAERVDGPGIAGAGPGAEPETLLMMRGMFEPADGIAPSLHDPFRLRVQSRFGILEAFPFLGLAESLNVADDGAALANGEPGRLAAIERVPRFADSVEILIRALDELRFHHVPPVPAVPPGRAAARPKV